MTGDVAIFDSAEQLEQHVADRFVDAAREAISAREQFFVSLAGGSTPKAAYKLLATQPRKNAIDWRRVQVFFGDERCVPPSSPDSNYRTARETFLSAVGISEANIHRIRGEDDPVSAALSYGDLLLQEMGERPRFDLILLGMGADGHTASLFPGTDPRTDEEQLVRAVYVEKYAANRITMTPKVINAAREIVVMVAGLPKAPAVYAVLRGPRLPIEHPIQAIEPTNGNLLWLLDRQAAAELPAEPTASS